MELTIAGGTREDRHHRKSYSAADASISTPTLYSGHVHRLCSRKILSRGPPLHSFRTMATAISNFEAPWLTKSATELDCTWYKQFVSENSTRHFSFTFDTLNALAGFSEENRRAEGVPFHGGHPDGWFVRSLLWQTNFECTRNADVQRITTTGDTIVLKVNILSTTMLDWNNAARYGRSLRRYQSLGASMDVAYTRYMR